MAELTSIRSEPSVGPAGGDARPIPESHAIYYVLFYFCTMCYVLCAMCYILYLLHRIAGGDARPIDSRISHRTKLRLWSFEPLQADLGQERCCDLDSGNRDPHFEVLDFETRETCCTAAAGM